MLKDPNTPVFEEKWPSMRPTILKLLRQEAVTRAEWHDLFWLVHSVCLWDDKVGSSPSLHLLYDNISLCPENLWTDCS